MEYKYYWWTLPIHIYDWSVWILHHYGKFQNDYLYYT